MERRGGGFTLIELIVVVALIAIMIAIAVPGFASFISNYRATSAVNDLLQGITMTRGEALKRGRKVTMTPVGGDWRSGWVVYVDLNANNVFDAASDTLIYQHAALPASVSVAGAGSNAVPFTNYNYVIFDGTGYARTLTGSTLSGGIVFTDATGSARTYRTLCLALMGRPRIVNAVDPCTSG